MYRDPSEFRERFKAYKDGKSVREIYGLPGYEPGKLPVEEMMPYILAVENPTKQGLVNGVWRPPTDSTKWDVHAIGGGLDIREQHNPIVYNYLKTNGRLANPFLTAREEEVLREKVFKKTMLPALQNVYNKYGDKISSKGYARLAGMKWQGHPFLMAISPDSVTGKAFIKAIESGDKDLDSVFDAYYKYPANAKRYAARILADTNYWKNHNTVATKPVPQEPIIAVPDATRVATIPTIQQKAIDYSDRRNAVAAEALRAMWAHNVMEDMKGAYQVPIWESHSLPALEPIELDVAPFKYNNGKLPGYQKGLTPLQIEETIVKNQGTIQQGHHWSPLSTVANSMYRDYRKPFAQLFTEGGLGNFARGLLQLLDSWNKEARGIADAIDHANVLLDIFTMGEASLAKLSAKQAIREAKAAAKKAIKPTKASIKEPKLSAPEVVEYHKKHPSLVKPMTVTPENQKAADFTFARSSRLSKDPLKKVELNMHSAKFPENTNIAAYATPYGTVFDEAYVKEMLKMGIMVPHEYEHLLQLQIKYTPEQASILEQAYPFSSDWLQAHKDFDLLKERGAMNSELAYAIGKKYGFPVGRQFDNVVKKMPNGELEEIASGLSAYNKHSSELRTTRPNVWPDVPSPNPAWNPLVRALTKVPATITVPLLAESQLDEYKDGKISINPANRGKFNATKKRTGKTTEELTHSKNPLTRKRAIFALNARKWHHADGKLPEYKIGRNPSHAEMNEDGTFTDDYMKVFEDMYITPLKVDLRRGSYTLNNFPEYIANRSAWMLTFIPLAVLNEKPLEQVHPEFDILSGIRAVQQLSKPFIKANIGDPELKSTVFDKVPKSHKYLYGSDRNYGTKINYKSPQENLLTPQLQDQMLGEYLGRGAERMVFEDRRNPNRVIKIGNGLNAEDAITDFDSLNEAIEYALEMNKLPGTVPMSYEGFIEEGGRFIPWFSQQKVIPMKKVADPWYTFSKPHILPSGRPITKGKLAAIRYVDDSKTVNKLGYIKNPTKSGLYNLPGYPYLVGDFGQKNMGFDELGNLKIFDPLIEL